MISPIVLAFLLLVSTGLNAIAATRLAPAEPLTSRHLEALLEPMLPASADDRRQRIDFAAPALPLSNPNRNAAELYLTTFDIDEQSGRFSGEVLVRVGANTQGTLALVGRISNEVLLPTLARPAPRGELVRSDAITMAWSDNRRLADDVITDKVDIVGLEAARRIPAGRPIRKIDLREPQLVRRGELIELGYRQGGLHITTIARARQAGGLGDLLMVTNIDSGKDLRAVVTGRKKARTLNPEFGSR